MDKTQKSHEITFVQWCNIETLDKEIYLLNPERYIFKTRNGKMMVMKPDTVVHWVVDDINFRKLNKYAITHFAYLVEKE